MVKSQANTVVCLLIARRPNSQVTPRRGSRITVAFNIALKETVRISNTISANQLATLTLLCSKISCSPQLGPFGYCEAVPSLTVLRTQC